jgi:hypothetical protein
METFVRKPDKRKPYQKVVIDGDTLEKRRDQRAEQLEKFIWGLTPEDHKGVSGVVNQWTREEGTRVVPASQSLYKTRTSPKQPKMLRDDLAPQGQFAVPEIKKRSLEDRVGTFVTRLKKANPSEVDAILQQIASDYWREGMPVTAADLRVVATTFLNRADQRKK